MNTESRREFEELFAKPNCHDLDIYVGKSFHGQYVDEQTQLAWEAWQAARERDKRIIEVLKDGLQTDGSHHKQWYLNEVLKLINADIAKDVETHWTHDGGIAP